MWETDMVLMLRIIINDLAEVSYTDPQLEQIIVVAAQFVQQEIELDTYTISISNGTIAPDPMSDIMFVNLVVLKAACMTDFNSFRTRVVTDGIEARAGLATLKVSGNSAGYKTLIEVGPCKAYENLKNDYMFSNGSLIHAVFSPFVSDTFKPSSEEGEYR